MSTVLITGAGGYVGHLVATRLAEQRRVVGIDLRPRPAPFELQQMDVRDPALADLMREEEVSHVVHLAAVLEASGDRARDFDIDVNGTSNVVAACVEAGARHLTVTSSGAAYGYHPDNPVPLREDHPLRGNPEFAYSDHKRQVEELLAEARTRHPDLGQLVLRVGTVLGLGTDNLITALFSRRFLLTLAGSAAPFVFIWDQDLVSIIELGVAHDRTGIYNVAGDGTVDIHRIGELMGKPVISVPVGVMRALLRAGNAVGLGRYGPEQVAFLRYRPVLDNTRLKTEFGFVPSRTSEEAFIYFADGLARR
jgi:UDP-glucose 4-epimerase